MSLSFWIAVLGFASTALVGQSAPAPLADLTWLAGDWHVTRGAQCVEEHWTSPSQNLMIGMSRTKVGGRTTSFEFVRIEARADGVFYVAQPGGRPPVDFKRSTDPGAELIFLNPGHADHLKRIVYRRQGDDGLFARVEGEDNGRTFAVDYAYQRGSGCGASQ